jgi:hypothetical protein
VWQLQCPTCPTSAEPQVWQVWQPVERRENDLRQISFGRYSRTPFLTAVDRCRPGLAARVIQRVFVIGRYLRSHRAAERIHGLPKGSTMISGQMLGQMAPALSSVLSLMFSKINAMASVLASLRHRFHHSVQPSPAPGIRHRSSAETWILRCLHEIAGHRRGGMGAGGPLPLAGPIIDVPSPYATPFPEVFVLGVPSAAAKNPGVR